MQGIVHIRGEAPRPSTSLVGILYVEDFADDVVASPSPPETEETSEPVITREDVEAACREAVATARGEWETSAAARTAEALASVASSLSDARRQAENLAQDAAQALAQTILGCLSAALPKLCEEHGPKEARELVLRLLPLVRAEPRILVRVHADAVRGLQEAIIAEDSELDRIVAVVAGAKGRGDVKVSWESGSLVRDSRKILEVINDSLEQLGLQMPQETITKRKLVHAD